MAPNLKRFDEFILIRDGVGGQLEPEPQEFWNGIGKEAAEAAAASGASTVQAVIIAAEATRVAGGDNQDAMDAALDAANSEQADPVTLVTVVEAASGATPVQISEAATVAALENDADIEATAHVVAEVLEAFGRVDVLVQAAGITGKITHGDAQVSYYGSKEIGRASCRERV